MFRTILSRTSPRVEALNTANELDEEVSRADALSPPPGYYESNLDRQLEATSFDDSDSPPAESARHAIPSDTTEATHASTATSTPASTTALPPAAAPVVMTWQPERPPETDHPVESISPRVTITYTFSQIGSHTMILVPPPSHRDTRPIYHISWREDFFLPGNYITTVRRGGSENGQFVGEFNLKLNQKAASVRMGSNEERWVADVLSVRSAVRANSHSRWRFNEPSPAIFWDKRDPVRTCTLNSVSGEIVARFASPNYGVRYAATQASKLEIRPGGQSQEISDHIIVSALLLERKRITEQHARWIQNQ